MAASFESVYRHVRTWAKQRGIAIRKARLQHGKAGQFNGVFVTMNSGYSPPERVYYLIHALGSIVGWSRGTSRIQGMFDELRSAKQDKGNEDRLERAIDHYRAFETEASEFAVGLLADLNHVEVIPAFSNFMRADLEALTEFHRTGKLPVWREFFARWNDEVERGDRRIAAYSAKAIPPFTPPKIEKQEILQEQG